MSIMTPLLLASFVVLLIQRPALGQEAEPVSAVGPSTQRGYFTAIAGASFEAQANPVFGVEYGDQVHRNVQAYATLLYSENVLGRTMRGNLDVLGTVLSEQTGTPWEFRGREKGLALTAGARFIVPLHRAFQPYVGAGAGAIRLTRTVTDRALGDPARAVFESGAGDDVVDISRVRTTRPMAEAVAGVAMRVGRAYVDAGYRFRQIYHTREPFEFSQVSVGIGVGF